MHKILSIVEKACAIATELQKNLQKEDVIIKEDLSPVTFADFILQIYINYHLKQSFPDILIMGEEDENFLKRNDYVRKRVFEQIQILFPSMNEKEMLEILSLGKYGGGKETTFWTVDPIDGTKGFINKEQFAVAIGLIDQGEVHFGALGCPNLPLETMKGGLFFAEKNKGTDLFAIDGKRERTLKMNDPKNGEIIYCEQHLYSKTHSHEGAKQVLTYLSGTLHPHRLDSQCKYALVAASQASIYLRVPKHRKVEEKLWDHAPGMIIVEEAGGVVSDLFGKPLIFSGGRNLINNFGVVASTKTFHDKIVQAAKDFLQP